MGKAESTFKGIWSGLIPIISYLGERGEEYENVILGDKDQNLLRFILLQHVANIKLGSTDLRNNMNIKTLAENTKTILDTRDGLTIAGKPFTVRNYLIFSNFSCMFLIPNIFSNLNCNLLDMRNLQDYVKKTFCYQQLFWLSLFE